MSSQTFDINSFIASLKGSLLTVQNQITQTTQEQQTAIQQKNDALNQLNILSRQYSQEPNGPSSTHEQQLQALGNSANSFSSTISSDTSLLSNLQKQASALQDQITAATTQANSIPRTTPVVSSTSTGLTLPNLSNISPVFLVAGAALLILLLK